MSYTSCRLHLRKITIVEKDDCLTINISLYKYISWCIVQICLPLRMYLICSWKSWKSVGCSGNMDSLSEFWILSFMKKKHPKTWPRWFFLSSWSFVPELTKAILDMLRIRERQKYADLLLELLCTFAKGTKQKFLGSFPEENMASTRLQAK